MMNQKRCLILISLRHLFFITILRNIKGVNLSACTAQAGEIMSFLYPKYWRNRLTAQHAKAVIMTSLIIVRRRCAGLAGGGVIPT